MRARLIYREKFIYTDGAVREMVLWQLPKATTDKPHGLKYHLYYGLANGTCIGDLGDVHWFIGFSFYFSLSEKTGRKKLPENVT